jgi:hypothetical protein
MSLDIKHCLTHSQLPLTLFPHCQSAELCTVHMGAYEVGCRSYDTTGRKWGKMCQAVVEVQGELPWGNSLERVLLALRKALPSGQSCPRGCAEMRCEGLMH